MLDAKEVYTATGPRPSPEEVEDILLNAADRRFVNGLIAQAEWRLGVDGLMFAAGTFEDAAVRRRAEEWRRA
jgi:hypothetical protein